MTVEGLHALTSTDIPHAYGLITGSRGKYLCIGLPVNGVDGVYVATVSEPRLVHVQVPQLNCMVHGARQKEVTSVVESYFPNGLSMLLPSLRAARVNKVPDLDITITRSSGE